jgi:putative transposase
MVDEAQDQGGVVRLFQFLSANQALFPVATMARVLGVPQAGCYPWVDRPASSQTIVCEALLKRARAVHTNSRQSYGAPRVHAELQECAEKHDRQRIARLMRRAGLVGASHCKGGPVTT